MSGDAPIQVSGYLISEELGTGATARVFRAVPEGGGEAVALKVAIRPELVRVLRQEGALLRTLRHPRFVLVLEERLEEDPPCFVLELCPGGDLRGELERSPQRRLPPARVMALAQDLLEGLSFAHQEGLVHGDLKPENLLLDHEGRLKIADLGLSRAQRHSLLMDELQLSRTLETEDRVLGTLDYIAPEVRAGGELTPACDVYAVGVTLYEALVGVRPQGLFRLPGELLRSEGLTLPPELDRVVACALAQRPEDRYVDACELRADLAAGANSPRPAPRSQVAKAQAPHPLLRLAAEAAAADERNWALYPGLIAISPTCALLAVAPLYWAIAPPLLALLATLVLLRRFPGRLPRGPA